MAVLELVAGEVPALSATPKTAHARHDLGGFRNTAHLLGKDLWPWQADTARVALERNAGRWRYPIVTVCVPRQSGKTTLVGLLAVHRCLETPDQRVSYTAQSRQDAVGRFRDFARMLRRSPLSELSNTVRNTDEHDWDYKIKLGVGNEMIEFRNGSTIELFAPNEDSLHGSVNDLVILDEARFLDESAGRGLMAAALPTMATRNGQLWIISTGGGPESRFLAAELERSRADVGKPESRRAHFEYGIAPDVPDYELLRRVWEAHPAAGRDGGPNFDALSVAADAMRPTDFAHEYGNRWRNPDDTRIIPRTKWEAGTWAQLPTGPVFLGVDVALDRSCAAVVCCVSGVLQVLEYRPGVTWVADAVVNLADSLNAETVWIDPLGPSGATALELQARVPQLAHVTSTREITAACAQFEDSCLTDAPSVGHVQSDVLDLAVARAAKRAIGQAWVWSRVESGPSLMAATLAHAAYRASVTAPAIEAVIW